MFIQQIIAGAFVAFFVLRLLRQKKEQKISNSEFILWIALWTAVLFAILLIKKIDALVASLGFTSSGLNVLEYLAIIIIFYFIFKLRIRLQKIENDITKIVRHISLNSKDENRSNK